MPAPSERRLVARLVGHYLGTKRGVFELADGCHVEVDGVVGFESNDAPQVGDRALVVVDAAGKVIRWEPYRNSLRTMEPPRC